MGVRGSHLMQCLREGTEALLLRGWSGTHVVLSPVLFHAARHRCSVECSACSDHCLHAYTDTHAHAYLCYTLVHLYAYVHQHWGAVECVHNQTALVFSSMKW
jgi:hypothetical protein